MTHPLVQANGLKKYFKNGGGSLWGKKNVVRAVDGIDISIDRGETLGLVGESGCGKSTLGRTILNIYKPTAGEIFFQGQKVTGASAQLKALRRDLQIIFQDPFSSLNPRQVVARILSEPMAIHKMGTRKEREERVMELMKVVGLRPEQYNRYPHEFSGGQRQRIGIARTLALNPKFVVCDEPVSALDVSIQSQIINLLMELQEAFGLTYLFISHDLSVIRHISDRVGVMYLGRMVELSSCDECYENPLHPYTEALLSVLPVPDPKASRKKIKLEGDVPSPLNPPQGCHFHTRCRHAMEPCRQHPAPPWEEVCPGHWTRCWRVRELRGL